MEVLLESEEQMGRNKRKRGAKASKCQRPAGTLTRRRGRPDRTIVGRTRARVARTPDHRSGELRRAWNSRFTSKPDSRPIST